MDLRFLFIMRREGYHERSLGFKKCGPWTVGESSESVLYGLVLGDSLLTLCGEKSLATVKVKSEKSLNRQEGEV